MRAILSEVELLLSEDVKEKKLTLSGARGRTGSRGSVGRMRFATDFMSRKEKREYQKCGKVVTLTMMEMVLRDHEEKLMELVTFNQLDDETKTALINQWRNGNKFSNRAIYRNFGISEPKYYDMVRNLGVALDKRKYMPRKKKSAVVKNLAVQETPAPAPAPAPLVAAAQAIVVNSGVYMQIDDKMNIEQLNRQLKALAAYIEMQDEGGEYRLNLTLAKAN